MYIIDQLNFLQCLEDKILLRYIHIRGTSILGSLDGEPLVHKYLCTLHKGLLHDFFPDWKAHRIQNRFLFYFLKLMPEPDAFLGKLSFILQRRKIESQVTKRHCTIAQVHCPAFNTRSFLASSYIPKRFNDFFFYLN